MNRLSRSAAPCYRLYQKHVSNATSDCLSTLTVEVGIKLDKFKSAQGCEPKLLVSCVARRCRPGRPHHPTDWATGVGSVSDPAPFPTPPQPPRPFFQLRNEVSRLGLRHLSKKISVTEPWLRLKCRSLCSAHGYSIEHYTRTAVDAHCLATTVSWIAIRNENRFCQFFHALRPWAS